MPTDDQNKDKFGALPDLTANRSSQNTQRQPINEARSTHAAPQQSSASSTPTPAGRPAAEPSRSRPTSTASSNRHAAAGWVVAAIILVLSWVQHNGQAAQIADLLKQSEQTKAALEITRATADGLKSENARLQEELDQANRPQAEALVSFIKPVFGNGYYARIVNTGSSTSQYSARISRPSTGAGKTWTLTIDSGRFTDIGEQEGWAFISGDTITITQNNHKSMTLTLR